MRREAQARNPFHPAFVRHDGFRARSFHSRPGMTANKPGHDGKRAAYCLTYFCTRQFSVSATKISSRGLTAM
jgi:hypothetical protein